MESQYITILFAVITSGLITLVAFLLYKNLKKSRYDKEENKALLESIRKSLENKMYGINERLVINEERWRDVNHLLIRNEYKESATPISNSRKVHYSNFLESNGIKENDLLIDERLIFILTPFNETFYEDYRVIKDVCTSAGYKCKRGDEDYFKGDIFPEMLRLIVKSNLIIANINGRNSNVMYELGIAQALDKPVLLISREPENLPIDIKSKRFLIYKTYPELQNQIRAELINLGTNNE
ncbi:hypothetical protein [uncultured Draconibacterium sp.]|uniref:hypothetical protein n=1 Tax=uncultured Draconibacterium sp. TaxID=1573823 RepID=UPI0029C76148|nr:hypothetical protein [uncultured Draconibacterium sp.]